MSCRYLICMNLCRILHTTSSNAAIHKTFRKVLGISGNQKKRKLIFQDSPIIKQGTASNEKNGTKSSSRRAAMLNKMFMIYITDLMVNGENWENYAKWGIEITTARVSSDYKMLNIYYISKKTCDENALNLFLNNNAYTLRHELSQLRVMGVVPPISFIKDKKESHIIQLDKSIETADYGADYQPILLNRLKHKLQISDESTIDDEIPEMPQNVFGLNHSEILKRIEKKDKKVVSEEPQVMLRRDESVNHEVTSSKDAFRAFLHKRQLLDKKRRKEIKNYSPDLEYIKQEITERSQTHFDNIENSLDKFKDYIIEEDK